MKTLNTDKNSKCEYERRLQLSGVMHHTVLNKLIKVSGVLAASNMRKATWNSIPEDSHLHTCHH